MSGGSSRRSSLLKHVVAFALAALVGSVTIALAWFWYRPLLALVILIVGAGIFYLVSYMGKKRQTAGVARPLRKAAETQFARLDLGTE